jgi:acyl-CoA synthetase (AMP-forming)/AMP-acid ligase II
VIFLEPDAPPVTVTHADFRQRAHCAAAALNALGIPPRRLAIIAQAQTLESLYLFWGALLIGAIPSMFPPLTEKLDPVVYRRNMAELARRSDAAAVFTTPDAAPPLRDAFGALCPVYTNADLPDAQPIAPYIPDPDEIAFLQHSSGTTGLQKGVALSHRAVLTQLAHYSASISLKDGDSIVSWLPLYHDMGLIAAFILPLVRGLPLILMSPFAWAARPAMLLRAIDAYRPTFCWLPNFAYNHMAARVRPADSAGLDLSSIRAFINCSEPVRHDSHMAFFNRFKDCGVRLDQLAVSYAMAENTFAVTQTPIGAPPVTRTLDRAALQTQGRAVDAPPDLAPDKTVTHVSCGAPIPGTQIKVVDALGSDLPADQVGEIYVKSDCMLTEYYRRPDLQPFDQKGWYHTGDRGFLSVDGDLYVVGRSKDVIIHAGKNIFPQDIEAVVNSVEGVHPGRAVAFGVYDPDEGTELIAVIAEVDTDDPAARRRINHDIRRRVGAQTDVAVNYVELVERGWLVKTSSGKIARGENRAKWLEKRGISSE